MLSVNDAQLTGATQTEVDKQVASAPRGLVRLVVSAAQPNDPRRESGTSGVVLKLFFLAHQVGFFFSRVFMSPAKGFVTKRKGRICKRELDVDLSPSSQCAPKSFLFCS